MIKSKLSLAALALTLGALTLNCGMPNKADAGTGGGTGGGTTGGGATGGGTGGGTTGGGTTGGGTTGGGTGRQCTPAPTWAPTDLQGVSYDPATSGMYPPFNFVLFGKPSTTAGRFDTLRLEEYGPAPFNGPIPAGANYTQCDHCFIIEFDCNNMGIMCAKSFLAQSATLQLSNATKSPDAGTFTFNASNLVYEEWNFTTDKATDGGCLTQASFQFTGTWP